MHVIHLREVPRWGGPDVRRKNAEYTCGAHASLLADAERTFAFSKAIKHTAQGRRVLDVGCGPFLLLGRMAHVSGATLVACIEDAPQSVALALEVLKREANLGIAADTALPWAVDTDLDEECAQYLGQLCKQGLQLRLKRLSLLANDAQRSCAALVHVASAAVINDAAKSGVAAATGGTAGVEDRKSVV